MNNLKNYKLVKGYNGIYSLKRVKHFNFQKLTSSLLAFLLIFQLIAGVFLFSNIPPAEKAQAASAITAFSYKKQITFNTTSTGAAVTTSQTNFPVAVHINASSWPTDAEANHFFDNSNVGGKRVQFFDSDETTNLDYEVEYYNDTDNPDTSEAVYWVRVPSVAGNSSTDKIVVAYGNDPNSGVDQ
ncbi:DUF2341 domain-containing protein, partial [Patescibacteria group bacterium]|nr:DUF2341 domain-containing protein [Patescibacteria group bacterium]